MTPALVEHTSAASSRAPRLTAAAISNRHVAVVTIVSTPDGLHLDPDGCAFFELKEDSVPAIRDLAESLNTFLKEKGISSLSQRNSTGRGRYTPSPTRTKLEFAVHRALNMPGSFIPSHVIGRWIQGQPHVLPAASSELKTEQRKAQLAAIETAAYALMTRRGEA